MAVICRLAVTMLFAHLVLGDVHAEWTKHVIVPNAKSSIPTAVATDIDDDGAIDVITTYARRIMLHRGPDWDSQLLYEMIPGRSRQKPGPSCIHSCLLDCDGDGDLDFVGSNRTVFWLENPGGDAVNGSDESEPWTYRTVDDEIMGTHCLITGDVNQDGRIDLIANSFQGPDQTNFPNSICWYEAPSSVDRDAEWVRHVFADGDAPGGSHYMGFGDINGDGRPDISCAAKGTDGFENGQWFAWWEQPADGSVPWRKHVLAENEMGATNIHPGDFDADGNVDFFATRGHGQGVLLFRGPKFKKEDIDPTIEGPHSLVTADLDGDGDLDAATCGRGSAGTAAWYENDGHAHFTRHDIGVEQGCYDLRAVDIDNDGDLDLLVAGHGSKNVVWYENSLH